ncbi:MAG TPA: hypothetical protein VG326_14590 [Tepidisphaeraceae bacterium]|nr:hypothetical protein [Tepidisphaeraceae bacterium]
MYVALKEYARTGWIIEDMDADLATLKARTEERCKSDHAGLWESEYANRLFTTLSHAQRRFKITNRHVAEFEAEQQMAAEM